MEFRRIFSKKFILIIILAFAVNLGMFIYANIPFIEPSARYDAAIADISGMDYESALTYIKKNKLASKDSAYKVLRENINYLDGYHANIEKIIANSDALSENKLFSDKSAFAYNNLMKTKQDFQPLLSLVPTLDNNTSVEKILAYNYFLPITILLMLLVIYGMYTERDNRMWQLVHIGSHGRIPLILKRIAILSVFSLALMMLFYVSVSITSFAFFGGLDTITNPVQNMSQYAKCALTINKLELLCLNFLWQYLSAMAVVSVLFLLFTIFRNKKNVAIGVTAFTIVEYLLYTTLESQSVYGIFKNVNIFNLLNVTTICTTYKNVGFGTIVLQLGLFLMLVFAAIIITSLILSVIIYVRMYPDTKTSIFTRIINKANEQYQKLLSIAPIFIKEIHKTIFSVKSIWLIAGVATATIYFSSTGFMQFSIVETSRDTAYIDHGGKDYTYIADYTNRVTEQYNQAQQQYEEAYQRYNNGELTLSELSRYKSTAEYYSLEYSSASEFITKLVYLKKLSTQRGIEGYMMSDRGYYQTFGKDSIQREVIIFIVIQIATILIAGAVVIIEKRNGMTQLINSSQKGRRRTRLRKMAALNVSVGVVSALMFSIDYINVLNHYGAPFLDAPIQSLTFMENLPLHISILQWLIILVAAKTAVTMAVSTVVYYINTKIGVL
ncbi:MAG: hypothetical protein ACI4EV_05370 [Lachnospiraceae bacterium]